jgi:hypothetical protein
MMIEAKGCLAMIAVAALACFAAYAVVGKVWEWAT